MALLLKNPKVWLPLASDDGHILEGDKKGHQPWGLREGGGCRGQQELLILSPTFLLLRVSASGSDWGKELRIPLPEGVEGRAVRSGQVTRGLGTDETRHSFKWH